MKKVTLISLLFVLLLPTVKSQNLKLEWGSKQEIDGFVSNIMGEDKSGVYTLLYKKDNYFIEKRNPTDFSSIYSRQIVMPQTNEKDETFEAIYMLKSSIVLFTSFYDKKADTYTSFAYKIGKDGNLDKASRITVFQADAKRRSEMGNFQYILSQDSSKIVIYNDQRIKKEKVTRLGIKLYDDNLKLLNEFEENIPLKEDDSRISVNNFIIDNNANVYFCLKKFNPKENNAEFSIVSLNGKTKEKNSFTMELNKEKISNLIFSISKKGLLNVSGYYCEQAGKGLFSYDGIAGVYFISYDITNKKIVTQSTQPFGKELLAGYLTEKQIEKGRLLPASFEVMDIEEKPDGGQILISEYRMVTSSSSNAGTVTTYYFFDIIVSSINPDGTIAWTKIIPKRQADTQRKMALGFGGAISVGVLFPISNDNTLYYSYLQCMKDNKLYFVFNDDPENINQPDMRKYDVVRSPKKSIPVLVVLDEKGNMTKKGLFDSLDGEIYLRPAIYYKTSPKNIVVYGTKKDVDKFGRIIIE